MKTSYILLAEHHDYNVQTKLCVLGLLNTHFGKSCIPDSFLTLSPHLEALCKTMLNLVDSDYFSHTILSSTTFQTDTTPRSIFFSQATNGLGRDWPLKLWESTQDELDIPLSPPDILMDYNPQFPQYTQRFKS